MIKYFKGVSALLSTVTVVSLAGSFSTYAEMKPNPIISRGVPAYSEGSTAASGNDEHYFTFCSLAAGDYLAYDLSSVPEDQRKKVIAVWYNTSSFDDLGLYVSRNQEPTDYTIEVNAAPGGDYPENGWKVVDTVTDNTLSSRQHLVDMEGFNWIRMNLSKADGDTACSASINFDIHNVSEGVSDSWLFLGDSITAGGMHNCYGTGFASYVNQLDEMYFPVQENGGIGGLTSKDGRDNIDRWLSTSPAHFVSIAYGTNDAWGGQFKPDVYYENTKYMIDSVLELGKVPVLPKIPYATNPDVSPNLEGLNAMIDRLWNEYGDKIVKGPDFYQYFSEHTENLSDGVHPDSEGYDAMRQLWAEKMYENVYTVRTTEITSGATETSGEAQPLWGDANCDGQVNMADAVMIMQAISNPDKYGEGKPDGITSEGSKLGDVTGGNDGLTNKDALAVQRFTLGLTASLPEA